MNKIFSTEFRLNYKLIAIIYICYVYKFPLSVMMSFYELYGDKSFFAYKALSCCKRIHLTDTALSKILDESKSLYNQILKNTIDKDRARIEGIEFEPKMDLTEYSESFRDFVNNYLTQNIEDLFIPIVRLKLSSDDLYKELLP